MVRALIIFYLATAGLATRATPASITVGSKIFPESYILAEIIAQTIDETGEAHAVRKFGLGGTGILFEALKEGGVDLYPEYSGTIAEAILKQPATRNLPAIDTALKSLGFTISGSLGFDDTYALAVPESLARQKNLNALTDLSRQSDLRAGLTHEFMERSDGYRGLVRTYGLKFKTVTALEHSLAYEALAAGQIDLTDIYSTDAKVERFKLRILRDDREYFPKYLAVMLARADLPIRFPKTWAALRALEKRIDERQMIRLNALSDLDRQSFREIARGFLHPGGAHTESEISDGTSALAAGIWLRTKEHLALVLTSLLISLAIGLPLGVLAARSRRVGSVILPLSGVIQTIPSLALLCFLIPPFGIGKVPALIALCLYGLLPIIMNTCVGLENIDVRLKESARAIGLTTWQRLRLVELPLASPHIMAGIKTSTIINIGTATLAALIGAGGYGTPIVTGLALNDNAIILQGAFPAAVMALVAYVIFDLINRLVIPKGLRIRRGD